jgi:hypothetical protein
VEIHSPNVFPTPERLVERLDVGWAIDVLHPLAVAPPPVAQ